MTKTNTIKTVIIDGVAFKLKNTRDLILPRKYETLSQAYTSVSTEKAEAYYKWNDFACRQNASNRGVIAHNCWSFVYGFTFIYDGRLHFAKITKDNQYLYDISEVM